MVWWHAALVCSCAGDLYCTYCAGAVAEQPFVCTWLYGERHMRQSLLCYAAPCCCCCCCLDRKLLGPQTFGQNTVLQETSVLLLLLQVQACKAACGLPLAHLATSRSHVRVSWEGHCNCQLDATVLLHTSPASSDGRLALIGNGSTVLRLLVQACKVACLLMLLMLAQPATNSLLSHSQVS